MGIENIQKRIAENVKERAELFLEKQRLEKAEKERLLLNKKRESVKLQAQIDHEAYLEKQQLEWDLKNESKTPEARTRESFRHSREIRDRDISRGLTWEDRKYKHMDAKTRRECNNAIAQGEVRDIRDFLKKKRLKEEASEQRRRRLKGL